MLIKCTKCNELIQEIEIERDELLQITRIIVHHHGETDSMEMTDEWQVNNQDFVFAINHNRTVGEAFKDA